MKYDLSYEELNVERKLPNKNLEDGKEQNVNEVQFDWRTVMKIYTGTYSSCLYCFQIDFIGKLLF